MGHGSAPVLVSPSSSAYASVKLEEFLLEYNYLLSSQLEQQRRIFEQSLKQGRSDMAARKHAAERELTSARQERDELRMRLDATVKSNTEAEARLESLTASHATLEAQASQLQSLHARLHSSSSSLRSSLSSAAALYTAQQDALLAAQDKEIAGLEDQLHDLRFYLDTQRKIDRMDVRAGRVSGKPSLKERLQSGQAELQLVEVAPDEEETKRKNRRNKRG